MCQATDLLRHPHLQPYVLQVNLKSSPAYNSLPVPHPVSSHIKKIRFPDVEDDSVFRSKDKRHSFGNERILRQGRPATERDSISSTRSIKYYPDNLNQGMKDLSVGSSQVGESGVGKATNVKPSVTRTPRYTASKTFTTPRKQVESAKVIHTGSNRKSVCSLYMLYSFSKQSTCCFYFSVKSIKIFLLFERFNLPTFLTLNCLCFYLYCFVHIF